MKVSKLDAARRQICTAIQLFMNGGDDIATHTLTAAAFRVTRDLCDAAELKDYSATKMIEDRVKPEYKDRIWKKLHESANFFKHANADPDEMHEFNPEQTMFLIFLTILQYEGLTGEKIAQMIVFRLWFMVEFPQVFNLPQESAALVQRLDHSNKQKFYHDTLMVVHSLGL